MAFWGWLKSLFTSVMSFLGRNAVTIAKRAWVPFGFLATLLLGYWLEQVLTFLTTDKSWTELPVQLVAVSALMAVSVILAIVMLLVFSALATRLDREVNSLGANMDSGIKSLGDSIDKQLDDIESKLHFDVYYQTADAVNEGKEVDEFQKLLKGAKRSIVISNASAPEREEMDAIGEAYGESYRLIIEKLQQMIREKSDFTYKRISQVPQANAFEVITADEDFRNHLIEAVHLNAQKGTTANPTIELYMIAGIKYPSTFTIIDGEWLILHATEMKRGNEKLLAEIYVRDPHRNLIPLYESIVDKAQHETGAAMVRKDKLGAHTDNARLEEVFGQDAAQEIRAELFASQGNFVDAPDYYDLLYSNEVSDLPLYQRFSEGCSSVLECGVGTGRVAISLAKAGIDVHGIDNSEPMLRRLQSSVVSLDEEIVGTITSANQDMREVETDGKFDAAIVSFGTLNFLESVDELDTTFGSIASTLRPGGRVLIELSTKRLYQPMINKPSGYVLRPLREVPSALSEFSDFQMFSVDCDTKYDAQTRVIEQTRNFKFLDEGGNSIHQRSFVWKNWFVEPKTVAASLDRAGFENINSYGDYELKKKYIGSHKFAVISASLP